MSTPPQGMLEIWGKVPWIGLSDCKSKLAQWDVWLRDAPATLGDSKAAGARSPAWFLSVGCACILINGKVETDC